MFNVTRDRTIVHEGPGSVSPLVVPSREASEFESARTAYSQVRILFHVADEHIKRRKPRQFVLVSYRLRVNTPDLVADFHRRARHRRESAFLPQKKNPPGLYILVVHP
jgi:hypothetical protein